MKPPRNAKPRRSRTQDAAALRARIATATVTGAPPAVVERARKILLAYVDAAIAQGMRGDELAIALDTGLTASRIGAIALQQQADVRPGPMDHAACAAGCAFCCILSGEDGAVITGHEARLLHGALAPMAGQPDGRAWHPRACPALDPVTRTCRAYDARPMICRAYISRDAAACEAAAGGAEAEGAGVLSDQLTYLAAHALARAALQGAGRAPTYSLASIAAAAVEGRAPGAALTRARHAPRILKDEQARLAGGYPG